MKTLTLIGLLGAIVEHSTAFIPSKVSYRSTPRAPFVGRSVQMKYYNKILVQSLFMTIDAPGEISSMRIGELKKELELLGISTKAMLEKKELVEALAKARVEGRQPVSPSSSSSASSSTSKSAASRADKIAAEMETLRSMSVGDMRKELQSLEIPTKSFFEKSEFIRALAEARVDGAKFKSGFQQEENFDPSYRDVSVSKMNERGVRGGTTIDVNLG